MSQGWPPLKYHRASGQGRVWIAGRYIYCGRWGTDDCQQRYEQVVLRHVASGRQDGVMTVSRLVVAFLQWAEREYPKSAAGHSDAVNFKYALKPLVERYRSLPLIQFGPADLINVRDDMIRRGWKRKSINRKINRIRQVVKWAVERQHVPVSVLVGLQAVRPLRSGSQQVADTPPVDAVPDDVLERTLPHVPDTVADLLRVLRYSGMRIAELLPMRGTDIDTSGDIWTYTCREHKTAHLTQQAKRIYLGPRSQQVLRPRLVIGPIWLNSRGVVYRRQMVWQLVQRACDKAGVQRWHPHQLRHSAAVEAADLAGRDAVRARLGQQSDAAAAAYDHEAQAMARDLAQRLG